MTDINWLHSLNHYADMLMEWLPEKVALGAAVTSVCLCMGIDLVLFYVLLCTLTGEMLGRVLVQLRRRRGICRALQRGIARYICYGVFLLLSVAVQLVFHRSLGLALPVADIFMCYLILTDCASILGHMHALDIPIPRPLQVLVFGGRHKMEKAIRTVARNGHECKEMKNGGDAHGA